MIWLISLAHCYMVRASNCFWQNKIGERNFYRFYCMYTFDVLFVYFTDSIQCLLKCMRVLLVHLDGLSLGLRMYMQLNVRYFYLFQQNLFLFWQMFFSLWPSCSLPSLLMPLEFLSPSLFIYNFILAKPIIELVLVCSCIFFT